MNRQQCPRGLPIGMQAGADEEQSDFGCEWGTDHGRKAENRVLGRAVRLLASHQWVESRSRCHIRCAKSGSPAEGSGSCVKRSGSHAKRSGSCVKGSGSCVKRSGSRAERSSSCVKGSGSCVKRSGSQEMPRDQAVVSRDQALVSRDQAVLSRDQAVVRRDQIRMPGSLIRESRVSVPRLRSE
jgi:hypothetical protein